MKTIKITNMKYDGHDFCGELSYSEISKIISEQPTELEISVSDKDIELYESDYRALILDSLYENPDQLTPTSFDFDLVD